MEGGGLGFTVLGVQRATTGDWMTAGGLTVTAFVTVDLLRRRGHALYLGAQMIADWVPLGTLDSSALLWGPSAMLGYRY